MKTERGRAKAAPIKESRVLIVAAPYYADVVEPMAKRAAAVLREAGAEVERIDVPGAFEIPGAIALAEEEFDGFVALGCVVRGETSHYDYVCGESARGLMDLSLSGMAIGYGVLTVENIEQAKVRADPAQGDKGAEAAIACAAMIGLRRRFNGEE
jgi:6,7-dimethyl-8-ribityllumazine synthase